MRSSTLKHIGILIIVLGVLSAVLSCFILKSIVLGGTSLVSAFLSAATYYALAEILDNQERIMSDLLKLSREMHNAGGSTDPVTAKQYNPPPVHNVGDSWICRNCGEKNPLNVRICKSCGQDK